MNKYNKILSFVMIFILVFGYTVDVYAVIIVPKPPKNKVRYVKPDTISPYYITFDNGITFIMLEPNKYHPNDTDTEDINTFKVPVERHKNHEKEGCLICYNAIHVYLNSMNFSDEVNKDKLIEVDKRVIKYLDDVDKVYIKTAWQFIIIIIVCLLIYSKVIFI